jgi:hypothetical protein
MLPQLPIAEVLEPTLAADFPKIDTVGDIAATLPALMDSKLLFRLRLMPYRIPYRAPQFPFFKKPS